MNPSVATTVPAERDGREISEGRKAAYRGLVELMSRLPAPISISFDERPEHATYLKVELASTEDFDAWVEDLGTTAWDRDERVGPNIQCHATGVAWLDRIPERLLRRSGRGGDRMTAPTAPTRHAEDWRSSPDLMSLDDKLDAAFGRSDPATDAWIEASIAQYRDAQVIILGGAR